jgi:hypothetical protein
VVDNREAAATFPKHIMCERPLGYIKGSPFVQAPLDFRRLPSQRVELLFGVAEPIRNDMIIERYKAGSQIMGQKLLCKTEWFGKEYYMFEDVDGTIYSTRIDEDGNPVWI